jgi:beta-glucosidase
MSRIETLLAEMTLPEKLGQLTMTAAGYAVTGPIIAGDSTQSIRDGAIGNLLNIHGPIPTHEMQRLAVEESRLGIPLLIALDVIHGHRTLFPIPLGEASAFDPDLWARTAREAAREAAAAGLAMTFAPMLDLSRDPRWGRTAEGPGEDAFVAVLMAQAKIRGFQGDDLASAESVAACAKHFCAYGPVTAGREYASVDISERTLREVHLPAFAAAVEAGVVSMMPAFTDLNGIPMTAHEPLLQDYLRGELGFDGVLISDYNAIGELLKHGVASDLPEAGALALRAGVDVDMMSDAYRRGLPIALDRGLVTVEQIDTCVRRVLRLKERLGLFDDPYRRGSRAETADALVRRQKLSRESGTRAIVLLKNENDTLPLAGNLRRLCVVGPLADAAGEMHGPWAAAAYEEPHVSVLAGLRAGLPQAEILHAAGVPIRESDGTRAAGAPSRATEGSDAAGASMHSASAESGRSGARAGIAAAVELCDGSDAVLLCLGEAANMSGEAASRASPELPGEQRALAEAVIERARARRIPVIALLFSGRPLIVPWLAEKADALVAAWFLGTEAGNAITDVLTGREAPSGRTPITWPRAIGQIPLFYGQRPSGRPENSDDPFTSRYLDVPNAPLYPFGHGLTYGRCVLSNLRVAPERVAEADTIQIRVDVTNQGQRTADETVFVFTHDKVASVTRPLLELKAFTRITVQPGATSTAEISLRASDLRFPGVDFKPVFEPGDVEILVGPCADRAQLLLGTVRLCA